MISNDLTFITFGLPIILVIVLYLIIRQIQNTHSSGKMLIDYFKIRQLDVIFAFIFIYIMFVFLAMTIIFAYNQLYIKEEKCDPLMFYLGSTRACKRTRFENFENADESIMDKFQYLGSMVSWPFIKLYLFHLAIIQYSIDSFAFSITKMSTLVNVFFIKQTEICDKVRIVFVEPLLIRFTDPLFKLIQSGLDQI